MTDDYAKLLVSKPCSCCYSYTPYDTLVSFIPMVHIPAPAVAFVLFAFSLYVVCFTANFLESFTFSRNTCMALLP